MHGEISLGVHHENEGQHAAAKCRPGHLLDPQQLHKFQVQAEKTHLRDRDFVQCIDVHGLISHHNYNKVLFPYVLTSQLQTNALIGVVLGVRAIGYLWGTIFLNGTKLALGHY